KIVIISFILGFNGFSVQAQVASIIAKTDIRFAPYFFARLLHGLFASFFCILLFKPLYLKRQAYEREYILVLQDVHENNWKIVLDILKQIGPVVKIFFIGVAGFLLYKRQLKTK